MVKDILVLVANGSRARFFELRPAEDRELESGPNLVEVAKSSNDVTAQPDRAVFADDQGRNRAPGGGEAHAYDDHRDRHDAEFQKRFAEEIVREASRWIDGVDVLVVAANPRMLGHLRTALSGLPGQRREVREYAHDVSKLDAQQIHQRLAAENLVPERKGPTATTRFRS